MTAHPVKWTAPSPLWQDLLTEHGGGTAHFAKPGILRFADDAFMDQYLAVLERSPAHIGDFMAIPETWREPAPIPEGLSLLKPLDKESKLARKMKRLRVAEDRFNSRRALSPASFDPAKPLKLFHPAHQRFYLVTAALVCGPNGLTDHKIDSAHQERVGFVVRRLFPQGPVDPKQDLTASDPAGWDEYAMVQTAGGQGWQQVDGTAGQDHGRLVAGEETLSLFPVHYTDDDQRRRRILSGVIPIGKREAYMGATKSAASEGGGTSPESASRPKTARMVLFRTQVAEPWKSLIKQAETVRKLLSQKADDGSYMPEDKTTQLIKTTRDQIQVVSWYVLLDFAQYLEKHLNKLWNVILNPAKNENDLESQAEKNLYRALAGTDPGNSFKVKLTTATNYSTNDVKWSLRDALRAIGNPDENWARKLDAVIDVYDREGNNPNWPGFLFPFADPELTVQVLDSVGGASPLGAGDDVDGDVTLDIDLNATEPVDKLVALVTRALPKDVDPKRPSPPLPLAAQKPFDHREGWFVIRCVYERPNCGPLHPAVMSEPTVPFQMAGFFDPDAPARPIRIALPMDTSPAGLRKFDKNTAFMISDMLCGQIKRAKGLSFGDLVLSVLPWPFHKDLPVPETGPCSSGSTQFGMICSLSIPIITICALILLTIIVTLLDIIFHWIPWFIVCFPLPWLKGKKSTGSGP